LVVFSGRWVAMFTPNTNCAQRKRRASSAAPMVKFTFRGLPFGRNGAVVQGALRTNPMNVLLIVIGCILMALGLVMLANRSGYVYFVIGPRSVLVVAGVVAVIAFWILRAVPR
jgi:hypothetical protein